MIFNESNTINTDLYQLTMMAVYHKYKPDVEASFEMFFRRLPKNRNYLVFAGLSDIINYLSNLTFTQREIEFLRTHKAFNNISDDFFDYLRDFKFTCSVKSVEEGEIIFPNEPVIQVTGPLIQAQLIETYLLSMINFQTMIATKASRIKYVAEDRLVLEFGSRRAHTPYASVLGAKASYIGGVDGTSNVKAGLEYNMTTSGTVAHSYIMSFDSETEAFKKYLEIFPDNSILLVDTYNTLDGVRNGIKLNKPLKGIRLDSGDLLQLSKDSRKILDDAGYYDTKIIASGDLNEYKIKELLDNHAPIDAFGVGTELITSKDDPSMAGVYKLVELKENNVVKYKSKFSKNKQTYPCRKDIFRFENDGIYYKDIIADSGENFEGKRLLKTIIKNGKLVYRIPELNEMRENTIRNLKKFDKSIKNISKYNEYTVNFSDELIKQYNKINTSK